MQKRTAICAVVIALLLTASACDYIAGAKKTLYASYTTWQGVQTEMMNARKAGLVDDETWAKVLDIDRKIVSTHNAALDAVRMYEATKGKDWQNKAVILIGNSMQLIKDGLDLYHAWGGK